MRVYSIIVPSWRDPAVEAAVAPPGKERLRIAGGVARLFDVSSSRPITSVVTGFVYFPNSSQRTLGGASTGGGEEATQRDRQAGRGRQHILFHTLGFHS